MEHAFQAAKTLSLVEREYIRQLPSPGQAKKAGRRVTLRPDWEAVKVLIILDLVRQKFRQTDLKTKLIDTFPHELIEINTWNDIYWGVCNGVGANMLGKILMLVRQELLFSKERGWPTDVFMSQVWPQQFCGRNKPLPGGQAGGRQPEAGKGV